VCHSFSSFTTNSEHYLGGVYYFRALICRFCACIYLGCLIFYKFITENLISRGLFPLRLSWSAMRTTAQYQNTILSLMLKVGKPMSLREITNQCQLTYHQVASCLGALTAKGYVKRIKVGLYEVTEEAKLQELSPEHQIQILKKRITDLENEIRALFLRLARSGSR